MIIRAVKITDCADIKALTNEFGFECSLEEMRKRLNEIIRKGTHKILVAEIKDRVIAFIDFDHYEVVYSNPGINITGLIVKEEFRKQGIGTSLIKEVEKYAKDNGMEFIRVNSGSQRIEAHQFYRKNGYDNEKDQKRFLRLLKDKY